MLVAHVGDREMHAHCPMMSACQVSAARPTPVSVPQAPSGSSIGVASTFSVSTLDTPSRVVELKPLHTVEAQRRRVPQAKSLPDPMVGIGWAGNITPFSVQSTDPSSYRSVSASQQLLYSGKLKLRGEIASKDINAVQIEREPTRSKRITYVYNGETFQSEQRSEFVTNTKILCSSFLDTLKSRAFSGPQKFLSV